MALCDENWSNSVDKGDRGVREQEGIGKVQNAWGTGARCNAR